jgi:hypothetical protein
MPPELSIHECPLCSLQFEGEECQSCCPMSSGCTMIRCPGCQYEFVEKSTLVSFVKRLFSSSKHARAEAR